MVQVYDLLHSGFQLLKRGLSVARVCEAVATRVVTQYGQAQPWSKGRNYYLAYYLVGFPHLNLPQTCRSRLRSLVFGQFHEFETFAGDSYEL